MHFILLTEVSDDLGIALPVPFRSKRAMLLIAEDMIRVRFTRVDEVGAFHVGYDPNFDISDSSSSDDDAPAAPRGRARARARGGRGRGRAK